MAGDSKNPPAPSRRASRERDVDQLELRIDALDQLMEAVYRLSLTRLPDQLYPCLSELLNTKFGIQELALFIYRERRNQFQRVYRKGFKELRARFSCVDPNILNMLATGEAITRDRIQKDPLLKQYFDDEALDRSKAGLWLPLAIPERIVGLLAIDKTRKALERHPHAFYFLTQLIRQVAVCIHTGFFYEKREREKEDLNKTIYHLSLLYDIGRAMTYISDLKSLLKYILTQAIELTGAEKGSIMLYDPDTNQLSIRVLAGLKDVEFQEKVNNNEIKCKSFLPGQGVAGSVFSSGKAMVINRTGEDAVFVEAATSYARSIACIPMTVYGDIIGVINVTNKQNDDGFSEKDTEMLNAVADQAAVSISKAQLWEMAVKDSLTGLLVRRYFMAKLKEEMHRTDRYQNSLSFIMADLDHFKQINDRFGHTTGDLVLKSISRFLQDHIRDVDIIGRYGGEEFVIYLPQTDKAAAFTLAERLRTGVGEIKINRLPQQTISMGVATYPADGDSVESLVRKADAALYAAKSGGRNRVVIYGEDIALPEEA